MALMERNFRGALDSESLITIVEEGSKARRVEMLSGSEKGMRVLGDPKVVREPSKGMKSSWATWNPIAAADACPLSVEGASPVDAVASLKYDCRGPLVEQAGAIVDVFRTSCCLCKTSR